MERDCVFCYTDTHRNEGVTSVWSWSQLEVKCRSKWKEVAKPPIMLTRTIGAQCIPLYYMIVFIHVMRRLKRQSLTST